MTTTLCLFEDGTGFSSWTSDPWIPGYPRRNFYALPYGLGPSDWQAAVDHAYANHCGWVYTTDDVLPNPWDTLPAYFEALADFVDASY